MILIVFAAIAAFAVVVAALIDWRTRRGGRKPAKGWEVAADFRNQHRGARDARARIVLTPWMKGQEHDDKH